MKKILLSLLVLGLFISCHKEGVEKVKNGNFTNELLFVQDGCKMYRFNDGGEFIYWSTCDGKVQYTVTEDDNTYPVTSITTIQKK